LVSFSTDNSIVPRALFSDLSPQTSATKRPRPDDFRHQEPPRLSGGSALRNHMREDQIFTASTGTAERVNLASDRKSPDHYAKGARSPGPCGHRALTACRRVVSGSRSSPGRGSSHLSLALLRSLSVASEYLALRDGPRGFRPAFTCPALLRYQTGGPFPSRTGLSPSAVSFSRDVPLGTALLTPCH
jgi:hypothetical protein